MISLVFN